MLTIFGGLPGTGKTTLARLLAKRRQALYLRVDTIEVALQSAGCTVSGPEGYAVAYRVAAENLALGHRVVADTVNPLAVTREAWRAVADEAGVPWVEIEIICSDRAEHQRRVEARQPDIAGHRLPTWHDVVTRDYAPWNATIVIDTAYQTPAQSLAALEQAFDALQKASVANNPRR